MTTTVPDLIDVPAGLARFLEACRATGSAPLIVGGSVRDALLARTRGASAATSREQPSDIDIEVHGVDDTARLLAVLGSEFALQTRGAAFQTHVLRIDATDYEFTMVAAGAGTHPIGPLDLHAAASRRDLTINALAWDPASAELHDPVGGLRDLHAGVLRHVSDRFADDPLRALRVVRFVALLGFEVAAETMALARSLEPRAHALPVERVWNEFDRLLSRGTYISAALAALRSTGWDSLVPELAATQGVLQDPRWHAEGDVWTHLGLAADAAVAFAVRDGLAPSERRLSVTAALLHDLGKVTTTIVEPSSDESDARITSRGHESAGVEPAEALLRRIGAPAELVRAVGPLVREHMVAVSVGQNGPSASAVRRLMRRLAGPRGTGPTIAHWARVVEADCAGRGASAIASRASDWLAIAQRDGGSPTAPLLTGRDLIEAGLRPGIRFSSLLDAAVDAQDQGLIDDRYSAREWLRHRLDEQDAP
jgi:tRNA nucleotidyltransferase (CCA-adding enzyme)